MIPYQKKLPTIPKIYLTRFYFLLAFIFCNNISNAQNWNWQNPLPQGVNLFGVDFTNANSGYAVGDDGVVLKTIDAGKVRTGKTMVWHGQNAR